MEQTPAIELFCRVVSGVADVEAAAREVSDLNRDQIFLKFVLVDRDVMAYLYVPAYPFAPEHLRAMLTVMSRTVDEVDDALAATVGGDAAVDHDGESEVVVEAPEAPDAAIDGNADTATDAIHPAMLTLLQLHADFAGSITPELAASVCAMDRDLVLELINWNSEQEMAWQAARDRAILDGDADEAQNLRP